jgi:hypothetical protein
MPYSMSLRVSPLAGFQVIIIGRYWVITEARCLSSLILPSCGYFSREASFLMADQVPIRVPMLSVSKWRAIKANDNRKNPGHNHLCVFCV